MRKTLAIFALAVACASSENATYIGCYADCANVTPGDPCGRADRDLSVMWCSNGENTDSCCNLDDRIGGTCGEWASGNVMTPSACSVLCKGFKFFGITGYCNCRCGNDYGNQGGKTPESDCYQPCTGDSSIMCGGVRRNSIYAQPPSMFNAATSSH
jgi:hypothetical protein